MQQRLTLTLPRSALPQHLKSFLQHWGLSGTYWKKGKAAGIFSVNGKAVFRDELLQPGDTVQWDFLPEVCTLIPEEAPLEILYEDDLLLAVNKPAGLITHNATVTLLPALSRRLAWYYKKKNLPCAVHPVSRLDKETSGIVLLAKNAWVHHALPQCAIQKRYLGLTLGQWEAKEMVLDGPIARVPGSIIKRQVDPAGLPSRTLCRVLAEDNNLTLMQFTLKTGRTHQIRVHCAAAGHPLLGDHLYGESGPQSRHFLHAWKLSFLRPFTGEPMTLSAPIPEDFYQHFPLLRELGNMV